jgi:hypothetical protein
VRSRLLASLQPPGDGRDLLCDGRDPLGRQATQLWRRQCAPEFKFKVALCPPGSHLFCLRSDP